MGKKRLQLKIGNKRPLIKCPQCNSTDITYYMGAQFGKYQCKNCGYVGAIIVEEYEKTKRKKGRNKGK